MTGPARRRGNASLFLAQNVAIYIQMAQDTLTTDTRVLYNDTCPVCRFEIDSYRRLAAADNLPIRFDRLADAVAWGLTPDQAAARLHVIHRGQLLSGIPAFIALWSAIPQWGWMARLVALPGVNGAACFIYDRVLAPRLYHAHLRRQAKQRQA